MVAPKSVLVCKENVMGFEVGRDVGVDDMFEKLAAYGGQGYGSVVTRGVLGAFFEDRTDVSFFPIIGTGAAGV